MNTESLYLFFLGSRAFNYCGPFASFRGNAVQECPELYSWKSGDKVLHEIQQKSMFHVENNEKMLAKQRQSSNFPGEAQG